MIDSQKYVLITSLTAFFIGSLGAGNAQAANFSAMGELHTGNERFAIYNNGLLNSDYSGFNFTDNGVTYTYDSWKVASVVLDFTETPNTGINLTVPNSKIKSGTNPIIFESAWTDTHYTGLSSVANSGGTWTSTTNAANLGLQSIAWSDVTGNYARKATFTLNTDASGQRFDFGESISFLMDMVKISGGTTNPAGNDVSNFNVSMTFVSADNRWMDTLDYTAGTFSGNKRSFPFDATTAGVAYIEPGNANLIDRNPPGAAVPEPMTVLGTGVAIAFGGIFKKRLAKRQK